MSGRALVVLALVGVAVVFAAGLFVPGRPGGALLLVTVAALVAVSRTGEARSRPQAAPLRVLVIGVVTVLAVVKLVR